ncbi:MAG TPA: protease inhibitor I42 family protein [Longimicrobium sp.]|jgi:predicted secreted protein|uniref:protease inhibitor I42 family protein n=1 Tax=Longimicrobium sp. TaxID=2029185 RepID=UPI002ED7DEAC
MRLLLIPLLLLSACARPGDEAERPSAPPAGAPVRPGDTRISDPRTPVRARVGQDFTITLAGNGTTAYQWTLADSLDARLLMLMSNDYVTPAPLPGQPPMAGQGGHERWVFRPLAPGQTAIRMKYARSWEKDLAVDSATFNVTIQP